MKQLRKINLSALSHDELMRQEQQRLKGGVDCRCTCTCDVTCACQYIGSASNDAVIASHPVTVSIANNTVSGSSASLANILAEQTHEINNLNS